MPALVTEGMNPITALQTTGRLIPAGTDFDLYRNIRLKPLAKTENEAGPVVPPDLKPWQFASPPGFSGRAQISVQPHPLSTQGGRAALGSIRWRIPC